MVVYVTSCKEMPLERLTNKNLTSFTETWKSGSFLKGDGSTVVIDRTNEHSNRCVDNNDSQRIHSFLPIFTM